LELLRKILAIDIFNNLRLVGGTSLALQIGHRISVDIDLFGKLDADDISIKRELNKLGELKTLHKTENINIHTVDGVKVDIVNYPYPWLENEVPNSDLRLASKGDIGAMKLAAITGRGTKKDFIDLFFLLKEFSLGELLEFYNEKYHDGSIFIVLRSLVYFEDADSDLMPNMMEDISWAMVKESIINAVKNQIEEK